MTYSINYFFSQLFSAGLPCSNESKINVMDKLWLNINKCKAYKTNKNKTACSGDKFMPCTGTQQHWNPGRNGENKYTVWVDRRPPWLECRWQPFLWETWSTLQPTAVGTVRGGFHQFPALCIAMARLKVPLWPEHRLPLFDLNWPLTAVRFHLEVSTNAVVLRHTAAVVNDPTLICTLVWWLNTGEAELVWDVASSHFDYLKRIN